MLAVVEVSLQEPQPHPYSVTAWIAIPQPPTPPLAALAVALAAAPAATLPAPPSLPPDIRGRGGPMPRNGGMSNIMTSVCTLSCRDLLSLSQHDVLVSGNTWGYNNR